MGDGPVENGYQIVQELGHSVIPIPSQHFVSNLPICCGCFYYHSHLAFFLWDNPFPYSSVNICDLLSFNI